MVSRRIGGKGGASLVKELLVVRFSPLHVEFEAERLSQRGIEAVRIVVVEASSVVEMYISRSRPTRKVAFSAFGTLSLI